MSKLIPFILSFVTLGVFTAAYADSPADEILERQQLMPAEIWPGHMPKSDDLGGVGTYMSIEGNKMTVDNRSCAVLIAFRHKLTSIHCLTGNFDSYNPKFWDWHGSFSLSKPNLAFVRLKMVVHLQDADLHTGVSLNYADGTYEWSYWDMDHKFYSRDGECVPPSRTITPILEYYSFFEDNPSLAELAGAHWACSITYDGKTRWRGANYEVLRLTEIQSMGSGLSATLVTLYYFGEDHLLYRSKESDEISGIHEDGADLIFTNLRTPKSLPRSLFTFSPPKGATAKEEDPETGPSIELGADGAPISGSITSAVDNHAVLSNGSNAPDFTVYDPTGKPVKLSDYAGRVVVLDFWATWCGPCQMSLPITSQVAKAYAGKNVTVLAVNTWDTKDAFNAWLPQHKDMSAIKFAIDTSPQGKDIAGTLYNVTGIPTQFVIDPSGKVAWSNVGYDDSPMPLEAAIDAALKAATASAASPVPPVANPSSASPSTQNEPASNPVPAGHSPVVSTEGTK